jgi:thiol:disulfide interchange protein DsbD
MMPLFALLSALVINVFAQSSFAPTATLGLSPFLNHGETFLALTFKNEPGYHTYWINPGDAGLPIKVQFQSEGETIKPVELAWPAPKVIEERPGIITWGYDSEFALFFHFPTKLLNQLEGKELNTRVEWLSCKTTCIPSEIVLNGIFKNQTFIPTASDFMTWSPQRLTEAFLSLPQTSPLPQELNLFLCGTDDTQQLHLYYDLAAAGNIPPKKGHDLLTPFPHPLMTFGHEELFRDRNGNLHGKRPVKWQGKSSTLPVNGCFSPAAEVTFLYWNPFLKKHFIVTKNFDGISLKGTENLKTYFKSFIPVKQDKMPDPASAQRSWWLQLLLAFLGGLILNFMPCVLPVVSLKLMGLIRQRAHSKKKALKHNLSYAAGVIFSLLLLAIAVIFLKSIGESVGWGFHLQSAKFNAFLILILFIFSLNLFGLFDFTTPGGRFLGNLSLKEGLFADFVVGILAVILATPCSAPFLGTAVVFAMSGTAPLILATFGMIGVGLASPFLLVSISPSLISFLPRPGEWMENLRRVMGLALLLTMIWLYDILLTLSKDASQTITLLNLALVLIAFALYMRNKTKKRWFHGLIWTVTLFSLLLLFQTSTSMRDISESARTDKIEWEEWSPEKINDDSKNIFMNFSAQWCLTCKANEQIVFSTKTFSNLAKKYDLRLLKADWTARDEQITRWLALHDSAGVPAYFLQKKNGTIVPLGSAITVTEIEKNLK